MAITQVSNGCYNCARSKWSGIFRRYIICVPRALKIKPFATCSWHVLSLDKQKKLDAYFKFLQKKLDAYFKFLK